MVQLFIAMPAWHATLAYLGELSESMICLCRTCSIVKAVIVNILADLPQLQYELLSHYRMCFLASRGLDGILRPLLNAGLSADVGILHPPMSRPHIRSIVNDRICTSGGTPLMVAVQSGHMTTAKLLIEFRADVNARMENGFSVIMQTTADIYAADEKKCLLIVRMMLSFKARLNDFMDDGRTPLMLACDLGHASLIRLLLKHGSHDTLNSQDDVGVSALMIAANSGHENVVRLLVRSTADIDASDHEGMTAMEYCKRCGHEDVVECLLCYGSREGALSSYSTQRVCRAIDRVKYFIEDIAKEIINERRFAELFQLMRAPLVVGSILVVVIALLTGGLNFV